MAWIDFLIFLNICMVEFIRPHAFPAPSNFWPNEFSPTEIVYPAEFE